VVLILTIVGLFLFRGSSEAEVETELNIAGAELQCLWYAQSRCARHGSEIVDGDIWMLTLHRMVEERRKFEV
jgi:hypothetical protein